MSHKKLSRADLPRFSVLVSNILRAAKGPTRRGVSEEAYSWYDRAHHELARLSMAEFGEDAHGFQYVDTTMFAGVVAALSPGLSWAVNVATAVRLLHHVLSGHTTTPRLPAYPHNVAAALRIAHGERPEDVLKGRKVSAFYRLLRDGSANRWDVCIDGHCINAAHGKGREFATQTNATPLAVATVADAYRVAAAKLGVPPHALQAAVWLRQSRAAATARVRRRQESIR